MASWTDQIKKDFRFINCLKRYYFSKPYRTGMQVRLLIKSQNNPPLAPTIIHITPAIEQK